MPPGASAAASDAPGVAVPRLLCLTAAAAAGGGRRRCGGHAAAGVLSVMRSLVFRPETLREVDGRSGIARPLRGGVRRMGVCRGW